MTDILGSCFGIRLYQYDKGTVGFKILIEDDEIWHEKNVSASTFWINDLIRTLERTRNELETNYEQRPDGFGYRYPGTKAGE